MVNTCGFVEAAKKDSVDTLLAGRRPQGRPGRPAGGRRGRLPGRAVRRGAGRVAARGRRRARLRRLPRHRRPAAGDHGRRARTTRTRRRTAASCCRSAPAERPAPLPAGPVAVHAAPARRRPDGPAQAGQRLRPALHVLRDPDVPRLVRQPPARATCWPRRAGWPARAPASCSWSSENSTSYGKDLGDLRLLETLLPELAAVDGVERVRVSYLQPAETRPGLIEAIATTPGVAPYFDLSFQHASPRCCAGCAASATPRASSACSSRSGRSRPRPASAPT